MRKPMYLVLAAILLLHVLLPGAALAQSWTDSNVGNVTSLSIAEDGQRIAIGGYDTRAIVLDAQGQQVFETGAKNVVTGVSLLNDGTLLVSSDDRRLYAFSHSGEMLYELDMKRQVKGVSASYDGTTAVMHIQNNQELQYFDAHSGEILHTSDIGINIKATDVSSDGTMVAVGALDQYLYVLDHVGERLRKMPLRAAVESVAISDEGAVAAGVTANSVELFGADGQLEVSLPTRDVVTDVAFSRDGAFIAASDFGGYFYIFSYEGEKLWETKITGPARKVSFNSEGNLLFGGTEAGDIFSYDVGSVLADAKKKATQMMMIWIAVALGVLLLLAAILYGMKKTNRLHIFRSIWRAKFIYLALVPSFGLLIVFLYVPAASGLYHSLYDWKPGGRTIFIGLSNFIRMLDDPYVHKGIANLMLLIVTGLLKALIPPLIVAELIYFLRNRKMQYWYRTAFTASMVIPGVAMLLIWQNLYDPNIGLINQTLNLLGLGSMTHAWLGDPSTAIWAIIFIGFPFIGILQLLVFYAGLLAIPEELLESAKMDGAGLWRIIRSIHLPLLAGQFKFLIILSLIGIIQDFNGILIVTGGGPMDSTYVPALQMYYAATKFDDLGYASALGVAMFLMIMVITVINLKFLKTQD